MYKLYEINNQDSICDLVKFTKKLLKNLENVYP